MPGVGHSLLGPNRPPPTLHVMPDQTPKTPTCITWHAVGWLPSSHARAKGATARAGSRSKPYLTNMHRAETSRAETSRAEVSRAKASSAAASRAEVSRAETSRAETSRAETSRAEASGAEARFVITVRHVIYYCCQNGCGDRVLTCSTWLNPLILNLTSTQTDLRCDSSNAITDCTADSPLRNDHAITVPVSLQIHSACIVTALQVLSFATLLQEGQCSSWIRLLHTDAAE